MWDHVLARFVPLLCSRLMARKRLFKVVGRQSRVLADEMEVFERRRLLQPNSDIPPRATSALIYSPLRRITAMAAQSTLRHQNTVHSLGWFAPWPTISHVAVQKAITLCHLAYGSTLMFLGLSGRSRPWRPAWFTLHVHMGSLSKYARVPGRVVYNALSRRLLHMKHIRPTSLPPLPGVHKATQSTIAVALRKDMLRS